MMMTLRIDDVINLFLKNIFNDIILGLAQEKDEIFIVELWNFLESADFDKIGQLTKWYFMDDCFVLGI